MWVMKRMEEWESVVNPGSECREVGRDWGEGAI